MDILTGGGLTMYVNIINGLRKSNYVELQCWAFIWENDKIKKIMYQAGTCFQISFLIRAEYESRFRFGKSFFYRFDPRQILLLKSRWLERINFFPSPWIHQKIKWNRRWSIQLNLLNTRDKIWRRSKQLITVALHSNINV